MSDRYDDAATIERLTVEVADCKSLASAVIERLTTERDGLLVTIERREDTIGELVAQNDELRAALTRVEARCEDAEDRRRWLTPFEIRDALKTLYADTPHNDPEFGFDKTAALSDPGAPVERGFRINPITPMCQPERACACCGKDKP